MRSYSPKRPRQSCSICPRERSRGSAVRRRGGSSRRSARRRSAFWKRSPSAFRRSPASAGKRRCASARHTAGKPASARRCWPFRALASLPRRPCASMRRLARRPRTACGRTRTACAGRGFRFPSSARTPSRRRWSALPTTRRACARGCSMCCAITSKTATRACRNRNSWPWRHRCSASRRRAPRRRGRRFCRPGNSSAAKSAAARFAICHAFTTRRSFRLPACR